MQASGSADQSPADIVIVGGGWAGLSAAIELAQHGQRCIVLESARQLGGRARSIELDGQSFDNGQHLFLGAYHNLLHVLDTLSVSEQDLFHRLPLSLNLEGLNGSSIQMNAGKLPAPLHLLSGFIKARGWNPREKMSLVRLWFNMQLARFRIREDLPLLDFLHMHHQSDHLIASLWDPLCTAALNTPAERASTRIFFEVLRRSFTGSKANSDMLLAKKALGEILPYPAQAFLQERGSEIRCMSRVTRIITRNRTISAIETDTGRIMVRNLVLATPFHITRRLLQDVEGCAGLAAQLGKLQFEPISTLYLRYPPEVDLGAPMIGLMGGTLQWLFDRRFSGQPGILSAVISARGPHQSLERQDLIDQLIAEIGQRFPHWPHPEHAYLVQEKQATFSCSVEAQAYRPDPDTPVEGCYLAGDYIRTLLPATLETAAWSGLQCARRILATIREQH